MKLKTVGVTGSQHGATSRQMEYVQYALEHFYKSGYTEFVHGDCIGVDIAAAEAADHFGYRIHVRPCDIKDKRAWFSSEERPWITYPVKKPLERNRDIVDQCDILLVVPSTDTEQLRSGTWATYRYAKAVGKPIHLFTPDGRRRFG